jgi:sugar/nucleoside kinase (ribokinase family)
MMTRPLVVGVGRVGVAMTGLGVAAPDPTVAAATELVELDLAPAPGVAVACSTAVALGCRARLAGWVGADALGGVTRTLIGRAAIDVEYLRSAGRSPVAIRLAAPTGTHPLLALDPPAPVVAPDLGGAIAGASAILVDGSAVPIQIAAAERARMLQIPVVADGSEVREGWGELAGLADVLISSERLASELAPRTELGAALEALAAMGPRAVVITMGGAGAIGLHDGHVVECPAFPAEILDPSGAGAVFHGAFAAGLLGALPFARCLELAAAAASLACGVLGAWSGVPTREAVLERVKTRL